MFKSYEAIKKILIFEGPVRFCRDWNLTTLPNYTAKRVCIQKIVAPKVGSLKRFLLKEQHFLRLFSFLGRLGKALAVSACR